MAEGENRDWNGGGRKREAGGHVCLGVEEVQEAERDGGHAEGVAAGRRPREVTRGEARRRAAVLLALAIVEGRAHALPDDVKALAAPVLAHRIRPAVSGDERSDALRAIRTVVDELSVPL